MTPEHRSFYVRGEDGGEYGPVELGELREWATENRVGLGTEVRPAEMGAAWRPWQEFPELVALLAEVHATGRMLPPLPASLPVLAPMGRRIGACLLDLFLAFMLVVPVGTVLYWLQPQDVIVQQIQYWLQVYQDTQSGVTPVEPASDPLWERLISFGIPLLYFAGFHALHGRTPAKSVLKIQVVDAQGRKPGFRMALLRSLVFMISVNLFGIPLFYAFFNPQRRALHDIAAGTYVVER